jgi:Na+/proline symporter
MDAVTQYWVKIVLGFVALALYVLSTPIFGGNPVFTFTTAFQDILLVAVIGAFGWATVQGSTAVKATMKS